MNYGKILIWQTFMSFFKYIFYTPTETIRFEPVTGYGIGSWGGAYETELS